MPNENNVKLSLCGILDVQFLHKCKAASGAVEWLVQTDRLNKASMCHFSLCLKRLLWFSSSTTTCSIHGPASEQASPLWLAGMSLLALARERWLLAPMQCHCSRMTRIMHYHDNRLNLWHRKPQIHKIQTACFSAVARKKKKKRQI